MDLQLSTQAYDRSVTGGPVELLRNMYAQGTPGSDGRGVNLLSGPGVEAFASGYAGGLRAILVRDGLFGGDVFTVHGDGLYRTTAQGGVSRIGTVPASGPASLSASRTEVLVCVSPRLYSYDGTSFQEVDVAGVEVGSITQIGQRFVASQKDGDRFYWSSLLDGRTWPGLNFATAEAKSDTLVRVRSSGPSLVLFGTETAEIYALSGNPRTEADAFYRVTSAPINQGLAAHDSVAARDAFVIWLSHDRHVLIADGLRPEKISSRYVDAVLQGAPEAAIRAATAFIYALGGHTFYVLTVPDVATLVCDLARGLKGWSRRDTLGSPTWRASLGEDGLSDVWVGNPDDPALYRLDALGRDDVGETIVQEFSVVHPVRSPEATEDMTIDGWADADATLVMTFTGDGGRTFVEADGARIASPGREGFQAMWRSLGTVRAPERIYRFRCTDRANLTIQGARINTGVD